MKRYTLKIHCSPDLVEITEDINGKWVDYSEVVNDPGHIPSMQVNELCRKLESLQTSIEKGHMEAGRRVWEAMRGECGAFADDICYLEHHSCEYNNCPLLEK